MSENTTHLTGRAIYARLIPIARPQWKLILVLSFFSLLKAPLALLLPLPMKIAVDSAIDSKPMPELLVRWLPDSLNESMDGPIWVACGLMLLFVVMVQVLAIVIRLLRAILNERMTLDFKTRVFRHLQRLSIQFHSERGTSDSLHRISNEAQCAFELIVGSTIPLVGAVCTGASIFYVSFRLDPQLTLITVTVGPIMFSLSQFYSRILRKQSKKTKALKADCFEVIHETLGLLSVVKAFAQEEREEQRFVKRTEQAMNAIYKLTLQTSFFGLLTTILTTGGRVAVLYVGIQHVRGEVLTLGNLILFINYQLSLYQPLRMLSTTVTSLQTQFASAERLIELLDTKPDIVERENAQRIDRCDGRIQFEDVDYSYEEGKPVLIGSSFDIPAGSRVGVFGKTGEGKSTILNLMMRFADPQSGVIRLDGTDLKHYRLADLRQQFAIVLQETSLMSTTIRENISYGNPDATMEEIVSAAQQANAHGFIEALPDGYDTEVNERGMRLSGGERQRIGIARAFLLNSPVLLLDEPTSAIDVETESEIVEIIERLASGRTTIMISHRLDALRNSDLLLQINKGTVIPCQPEALDTLIEVMGKTPH